MRKKLYTILGTFALITAFTIVFVPKEVVNVYADDQSANVAANIQVGDLNGDNIIDSSDAVLIKKYLSGSTIEGFTEKNADLNGDGEVTSVDSVLLMKYLAGYDVKIQPQPDSEIAKTVKYTNNDYVYHPSMEEIKYDSDENVIYFNNLLTVYTFTDLNEIEMKELTDAVDGTVVGDISGCVNVLQIEVKDCSFNELNEKANTLMENENVLYAGYDYPMQMSDDSVSSDPWNSNPNKPESDLGNEDAPNGNDWWAEAIGAYTAWDNVHDDISKIKAAFVNLLTGYYHNRIKYQNQQDPDQAPAKTEEAPATEAPAQAQKPAVKEAASKRVQALLSKFVLYPELDLDFLKKEFVK